MTVSDWITAGLFFSGAFFFLAGTVGLLRFPDVYTRLHALTKADNLGLGLITTGLVFQSTSIFQAVKLVLIWLLVLITSASAATLIARYARRTGMLPWKRGGD